jgi:hypothetical protein
VDVGFEESEDGCGSRKVEVPDHSWLEVGVMLSHCVKEGQHHRLLAQVKGRIHYRIAGAAVAVAEAAGSCRSAEERDPCRGTGGWMMDGRTIATVEVVVAAVCYGSWMSKIVSEGGSATAWPLPGRVRRV